MPIEADVLLVDGRNTLWRNCAANSQLGFEGPDGWQMTGGVYGFFESVLSALWKITPGAGVWVAWEGDGGRDKRRAIIPEYKVRKPSKDRDSMADQVFAQEAILKEILPFTIWGQVVAPGWEADDAMGTMAQACRRAGLNTLILSNDADMLQCIRGGDPRVSVFKPGSDEPDPIWDDDRLMEEWKLSPAQVIDFKALAGDSSDNYSGAKGIGEVWARKIIAEYGGINEAIDHAEEHGEILGSADKANKLILSADHVRKCYDVATIRTNLRVKRTEGHGDPAELRTWFRKLKFMSLLDPGPFRRISGR